MKPIFFSVSDVAWNIIRADVMDDVYDYVLHEAKQPTIDNIWDPVERSVDRSVRQYINPYRL
jgi:hypothetical protein